MNLKIVESSLNLRVERRLGKENKDYLLSKEVAEEQLKLDADVYCNVEYMECKDEKYMEAFEKAGYTPYKALDTYSNRGILYMVRNGYSVKVIHMFEEPHMMHIQLEKAGIIFNIITVRILIAGSDDADYISRREQLDKVLEYIDSLENKDNLCDKCRKLLKNNNTDIILISAGIATGTILFMLIYYLIKLLMK